MSEAGDSQQLMLMRRKKFRHVLDIWFEKPHVACPTVFAAKLQQQLEQSNQLRRNRLLLHNDTKVPPLAERAEFQPDGLAVDFLSEQGDGVMYRVEIITECDLEQIKVTVPRVLTEPELKFYSPEWLQDRLEAKLNRWLSQCGTTLNSLVQTPPSLAHVDLEFYQATYHRLKTVYGPNLVANWTERTNPEKFVYEDIGIAAYLLCLWQGLTRVRFADIGCGNGLLVFLLNSEGHHGTGYDMRRRRIWDTYPEAVRSELIEATILPTSPELPFAVGFDWLIGNHSDELTLWLPVWAAKFGCSGVFVLPCCPYNLDGTKFGRGGSQQSRYRDYLDYVGETCRSWGFTTVHRDCLRIPSTRRVCFVATGGRSLSNEVEDLPPAPKLRKVDPPTTTTTGLKSRSCLGVERRRQIELALFHELLLPPCSMADKDQENEDCESCDDPKNYKNQCDSDLMDASLKSEDISASLESVSKDKDYSGNMRTKTWNSGRTLALSYLASQLTDEDRAALRSERGGLQTLLRNCHQAFSVGATGLVSIRRPEPFDVASPMTDKQRAALKTKPCWMDAHHPDGCRLSPGQCAFRHACESCDAPCPPAIDSALCSNQ